MAKLNNSDFIWLGGTLRSVSFNGEPGSGRIAVAVDVYDEELNQNQEDINKEVAKNIEDLQTALGIGGSGDQSVTQRIEDLENSVSALSGATVFKGVYDVEEEVPGADGFFHKYEDKDGVTEETVEKINNGDIIIYGEKELIWLDSMESVMPNKENGKPGTDESGNTIYKPIPGQIYYKWVELGDVTAERKDINDIKENYASVAISTATITSILTGTYTQPE